MKRLVLSLGVLFSASAFGQSFSDNFDAYTAGQYMAQQSNGAWTTWNNTPGTTEDVLVSSVDAQSGSNSIFLTTSTQGGGPTDLVRNFGVLNTGQFSMEFNLKVQTGKAGYFNFQRNATLGQVWAMDCFFTDNGQIIINNQSGLNFTGAYTQNVWFNFRIDIDFNTNTWEVFIDDTSIGTFANTENQIASIDFYPTDQNAPYSCGYFVDDFQYTVTPYTLTSLNGAVNNITYSQANLAGVAVTPKVTFRNIGTTTITSATIEVSYNGNTISNNFTGLNLASLASTTFTMPNTLTLAAGQMDMIATLVNVNGTTPDGDVNDDIKHIPIQPVVPATGKMVVGEEGTGTWCGWCPRGAVFMEMMEDKYSNYWAGIAVHNGDPMTVSEYDGPSPSTGYPSGFVDRGLEIDPSEMENDFLNRVTIAPKALITNGATFDAGTRTLNVSVSANFLSAATNNYKLAIALTEDGVTGTGTGYNQSNYYAGGGSGVMGGFETLPSSVPAAQMVYDHVGRTIAPSFAGSSAAFPATINSGETHTINFTFDLPTAWDENEMHIIGMLIAPDGRIDNAGKTTITEAIANGFVSGTAVASVTELEALDATLAVYPNPATDLATIAINLEKESNLLLKVIDMNGKTLASRDYGMMNGASTVTLNTSNYTAGVYIVELTIDHSVVKRLLVVQ